MPSIKENIKEALLNMVAVEQNNCSQRISLCDTEQEKYQVTCERNFLGKLEAFVKSL